MRKCTCLVDTESDSEDDVASLPLPLLDMSVSSSSSSISSASSNATLEEMEAIAAAAALLSSSSSISSPAELRRKVSGYRDAISTSTALHNSEALRQAQALQNVFCACYDVDTVLTQVQRRERTFSPIQLTLLTRESITTVFRYATSFPERSRSSSSSNQSTMSDADRYHRSAVATGIIAKFYLKAMTWHGSPKPIETATINTNNLRTSALVFSPPTSPSQRRRYSADASAALLSPTHRDILSFGSAQKSKAQKRRNQFGTSLSTLPCSLEDVANGVHLDTLQCMDSAEIRGYILRLEDLTEPEWKSIFSELYKFMWECKQPSRAAEVSSPSSGGPVHSESALDTVLIANMCRVTKHFVVYPSVHKMLASLECPGPLIDGSPSTTTLFPALSAFAYSSDIAALIHGVIHIAQRRQFNLDGIIQSLVYQIVSAAPNTARFSAGNNNAMPMGLTTPIFSLKKPKEVHETISGCAELVTKILAQQFPNTFRYYIHTKVQLASFESVESFERELFPPKTPPSDPSLHADIKNAVMAALLDDPETLLRLADVALAELRFLDTYHDLVGGSPPTLVVDVIRCAIDNSLLDRSQLELFLPCFHNRLLEVLSTSINFHQHMSTISEFASRECFSDSDSDDASAELDEDDDDDENDDDDDDDDGDEPQTRSSRPETPTDSKLPVLRIVSSPSHGPEDDRSKKDSMTSSSTSGSSSCLSPVSGKQAITHRPLTSIDLILHVVDFFDAVIRMGIDTIDNKLMRLDLSTSLIQLFEKYPKANVLHSRLLKLFLGLFDRKTTGRVNNPFLRSVFRHPNSIQSFIMSKLNKSAKNHPYDPHLAILGVKIDKICSAPSLQQEVVVQYCTSTAGWGEFASSLVARHYQQMDALDDLALAIGYNGQNGGPLGRRGDGIDDVFPLARSSSSSCDFLTNELQPFKRLPIEKEGFGSSQNLADGSDAVNPTDMLKSRAQSQFPKSIIDILRSDTATSFEAMEDENTVVGYAYQKLSKWVKVQLKFDKSTCILVCQEVPAHHEAASNNTDKNPATTTNGSATNNGSSSVKKSTSLSTSKLKQLWMQHKPQWTSRPKKVVVCTARKWIAFGRTVKNPNVGAFGFQVDVFDRIREEDQTLTFVTRSEQSRTLWFEAMQNAVLGARTLRHPSFADVNEEANINLVKCVATQREGTQMVYLALPDVHVLGPVISSSFLLKSEVPEEIPIWGTFQGPNGVSKYCSLFKSCLHVMSVQKKSVYASGYSVLVEFDATLQAVEAPVSAPSTPVPPKASSQSNRGRIHLQLQLAPPPDPEKTVTCSFTDTYLVSGNQIISLTRTIADSEKLVKILCVEDETDDRFE